jgi:hypothetical protein
MNVLCSIFGPFFAFVLAYHVYGGVVKMDHTANDSKWQIYLESKTTIAGQEISCIICHMFSFGFAVVNL